MPQSTSHPILFFGLLTLDLQYFVSTLPGPNDKIRAEDALIDIGGPATNAAATCSHLGSEVTLLSALGQSPLASFFLQKLEEHGVRFRDLTPDRVSLPPVASIYTLPDGQRSVVVAKKAFAPNFSADLWVPLDGEFSALLLDGSFMPLAQKAAQWARSRNIPVVLDGGSWKEGTEDLLPWVDYAICSEDFKVPGGEDVLAYLADRGVAYRAISKGGEAIVFEDHGQSGEIEVPRVKVVDTLGAGDVLHGAFCHFLAKEESFAMTLRSAAEVASYSCQFRGAKSWMDHLR